jgi:hypothetical protein
MKAERGAASKDQRGCLDGPSDRKFLNAKLGMDQKEEQTWRISNLKYWRIAVNTELMRLRTWQVP